MKTNEEYRRLEQQLATAKGLLVEGRYVELYKETVKLQKQLADREKQLANAVQMLSEQDFEYNRKTNDLIERHAQQLAASKAREEAYRAEVVSLSGQLNVVTAAYSKQIAATQDLSGLVLCDAEPIAWLHSQRFESDVITDKVKHLWGRVKQAVGREAQYTIPLYKARK